MRRTLTLLIMVLFLATSAALFGAGEKEESDVGTVSPMDQESGDPLLVQGLPPVEDREFELEMLTIFSGAGFDSFREYLDTVFEAHYPNITVVAQETESGNLGDIVNTRLAAGNPPPVVHSAGSYAIQQWAEAGALIDVTEYWEAYNLEEIVPDGIAANFRFNGNYYGMPISAGMNNIFYYNLNKIREAGVAEPPYDSWDEFFEVAQEYVDTTGEPFWIDGYSPAWFGMAKTIGLAPSVYGPEIYARILNGEATEEDFRNALSFYSRLYEVGNSDFMSMNSITGGAEAAARGDGVVTMLGGWGYPRFVDAGLELGEEWTMGMPPGHEIVLGVPSGMVAFRDSGFEDAAVALMLSGVLKETQNLLQPEQGNMPIRTDVDPANFPEVGRYPVSRMAVEASQGAVVMPRENAGLPSVIVSEYPPTFSAYFAGDLSAQEAAAELVEIQSDNQDAFSVQWNFEF